MSTQLEFIATPILSASRSALNVEVERLVSLWRGVKYTEDLFKTIERYAREGEVNMVRGEGRSFLCGHEASTPERPSVLLERPGSVAIVQRIVAMAVRILADEREERLRAEGVYRRKIEPKRRTYHEPSAANTSQQLELPSGFEAAQLESVALPSRRIAAGADVLTTDVLTTS